MKKFIVLVLAFTIILTLIACGVAAPPRDEQNRPGERPPVTDPDNPQIYPVDPGVANSVHTPGFFPFEFSATDIHGNTVTEASMGEKDLFFVHYWGTWCGPCIMEMPDIAKIVLDYGDRVGFLMLLNDFENADAAIDLYKNAGYPDTSSVITIDSNTFDANHPISWLWLMEGVVPVTVYFDADGNHLRQRIGTYFDRYRYDLDEFLS